LLQGYRGRARRGGFRKLASDEFCILRDPIGIGAEGFGDGF